MLVPVSQATGVNRPPAPQFIAPRWACNRHLQTVWAPLFRPHTKPPRGREKLELPDGDFLNLDWVEPASGDNVDSPLTILLHGLAGSGDSVYIVGMQHALRARGLTSVTMYFRSAGGEPNRLARIYHGGDTRDLEALIAALQLRFPGRPLLAIGYSLGGNVLLKHLGERGAGSPLRATTSVCAPLELGVCADQLDIGLARVYRNRLLRELLHNIALKREALLRSGKRDELEKLLAIGELSTIHTFRQYDGRVIAPLHGFRDADDYYRRSSARQFLGRIVKPTLLVHAVDDPFMTPRLAPRQEEVSAAVTLAVSEQGGHVGFVQGPPWQPRYWLEETIPDWLLASV